MKTKKEQMFKTLSEKELKNVMGGLVPPTKDDGEKKSPIQKIIDELMPDIVCW